MSIVTRLFAPLAPWSGLLLGGIGWTASTEIGSARITGHCQSTSPVLLLLISLVGLAVALTGGWLSYRAWRTAPGRTRQLIGLFSLIVAGGLIVAILFHILAALLIPRCFA
jgi:hypothetical protein